MVDPSPPRVDPTGAVASWMRYACACRILRQVASAFEAQRIPCLPVKGIVTAHTLYDDVARRPFIDIDLRIPRRHFGQAVRVARSCGWNPNTRRPRMWEAKLKVDEWEV